MKTYKLSKPIRLFHSFMLGLFALAGIFAAADITRCQGIGYGALVAVLWFGVLSISASLLLRIPAEISIRDDQSICFKSPLRTIVLTANDIHSITAFPLSYGFLKLKHSKDVIQIINNIDGFHELITSLKNMNPGMIIKGC